MPVTPTEKTRRDELRAACAGLARVIAAKHTHRPSLSPDDAGGNSMTSRSTTAVAISIRYTPSTVWAGGATSVDTE